MDWTFVRPRAQKAMIDLKTFCHDFLSNFVNKCFFRWTQNLLTHGPKNP